MKNIQMEETKKYISDIEGESHEVIYIEYHGESASLMVTKRFIGSAEVPYWRPYHWDLFLESGDKKDIRAFNSGDGGSVTEVLAPVWVNNAPQGGYWKAEGVTFRGTPRNALRLELPKLLKSYWGISRNPLEVAKIVGSNYYCDRCKHESTEICVTHIHENEEGELKYIDDNSSAE